MCTGLTSAHPSYTVAVLHVVELIRFQMMLCMCNMNRALVVSIHHVFIDYKLYHNIMWTVAMVETLKERDHYLVVCVGTGGAGTNILEVSLIIVMGYHTLRSSSSIEAL